MSRKNKIKEYFSKELVLTVLGILFSIIIFFFSKYFEHKDIIKYKSESEFNSLDSVNKKNKLRLEAAEYINSIFPNQEKRFDTIQKLTLSISTKNDTLNGKRLKEILNSTSKLKFNIINDISELNKFTGLDKNDGFHDDYLSHLKLLDAEKKLVDEIENYTIFLMENGLNAIDNKNYLQLQNSLLNIIGVNNELLQRKKYLMKFSKEKKDETEAKGNSFIKDIGHEFFLIKLYFACGLLFSIFALIIIYYSIEFKTFKNS